MQTRAATPGRLVAVRLTEIPLQVRRKHGEPLMRELYQSGDMVEALRLTRAIEDPSDRVHWVPLDAVRR